MDYFEETYSGRDHVDRTLEYADNLHSRERLAGLDLERPRDMEKYHSRREKSVNFDRNMAREPRVGSTLLLYIAKLAFQAGKECQPNRAGGIY